MKGYPSWFSHWVVLGILGMNFVSGVLLVPVSLAIRLEWDVPYRLHDYKRILAAAAHATSSFALIGLLGALWSIHMRHGWRNKERRASGSLLVAVFILLVVTGIGIYYLGDEVVANRTGILHLILGLCVPFLYAVHFFSKKRSKSLREKSAN